MCVRARRFGGLDPEASDLVGDISDLRSCNTTRFRGDCLALSFCPGPLLLPLPLPLGVSVDTLDRCDCLRCSLGGLCALVRGSG